MKIELVAVFGVLFAAFAAIYALFLQPKSLLHRRFSMFMFFLAVYSLMELETVTQNNMLLYQKIAYLAGLGVAVSFTDYCFAYPTSSPSTISRYLYIVLCLWIIFSFSPDFIQVRSAGYRKVIEHGNVFPYYLASFYLIFAFGAGRLLHAFSKAPDLKERLKVGYLLIGLVVAGSVGLYGNLLFPGLSNLLSLPPASLLLLSMFTSYALLQEHPLELKAFFKKTLFYYLLVAVTIGLYVLGVKLLGDFFSRALGLSSFYIESLLIVALAFIFKPVANWLEEGIQKLFVRYEKPSRPALDFHPERYTQELPLMVQALEAIKAHYDISGIALIERTGNQWGDLLPEAGWTKKGIPEAWRKAGFVQLLTMQSPVEATLVLKAKKSGIALSQEEKEQIRRFFIQVLTQKENIRMTHKIEKTTKLLMQKERMAELGTLTAGLAHELKNPMANIQAAAQMLQGNSEENEKLKFSSYIIEEVNRVQKLVRSLLLFASPHENKTTVDLGEIVATICKREREAAERKGVHLSFQQNTKPVELKANVDFLEVALSNVVRNAIEATSEGQVLLSIEENSKEAIFLCKDTGCGIDREKLAHIFEPFYSTKKDGHGLGLAILKQGVENAGGRIEVESRVNHGTVFKIYLPKDGQLPLRKGETNP